MSRSLPSVCVIGAGSCGLPVIKALRDKGLPVTCFERTPHIGGIWCIDNKPYGATAAYESLHINTDTRMMEYRDLPMPPDIPDYPGHEDIYRYFRSYADRFGLWPHIELGTTVTHARRREDGVWQVTTDRGGQHEFDALVVANGHHWEPRWPEPYPGQFDGLQMHSHAYLNPDSPVPLRGKRVMVVGFGNSAMDIACELGQRTVSERCLLSVRRMSWVMPKWVFGRPVTRQFVDMPHWIPWWVGGAAVGILARIAFGRPTDYGLPQPDHRWFQSHPTISQEFYSRIGHGDVIVKPGIRELAGREVRFVDGSSDAVDAIVWCTGYKIAFPFFDDDFLPVRDNYVPLWMHTISPGIANLFFVGLYQPLGSIMQPAELQAKLIAGYLCGEVGLPDQARMRTEIERERAATRRRYVASPRHTMQVDFAPFLHRLRQLHERGAKLARRRGNALPVPPRAAQENRKFSSEPIFSDKSALSRIFATAMSWDLPSPFIHERIAVHAEIDGYGHVNNAVYVTWLDDCAWAHSTDRGIPPEMCRRLGRGMAVWRTQINYLLPALEGDHIQVATWPVRNDQRLRIDRRFQIRRGEDGATLLRALIHYVCIDLESGRARRMPAEFTRYTVAPEVEAALRGQTERFLPGVEPE